MAIKSVSFFIELESLQQVVGIGAPTIKFRKKLDRFLDPQLVRQASGLQDRADFLLKLLAGLLRVEAANPGESRVLGPHSLEDLDGRRFSRAVWPQQAQYLAFFDRRADSAQRCHGTIVFIEILDLNDRLA